MSERVLSIQSHVAFGYVGGKAAVFPLQCLGYDVDVINTVNFSNHTGYARFGGSKTSAVELAGIFQSMRQNELLMPDRLLTGFIPGGEALSVVADLATNLKREKSHLIYVLDPVLGDAGRLYVNPDAVPVYRSMLALATVITPNWFEVEVLTKVELKDFTSLRQALEILHKDYHVPNVVISSIPLQQWLVEVLPPEIRPSAEDYRKYLVCISSSADSSQDQDLSSVHAQRVPLLPGYFSGVGDLFSALLMAHFQPSSSLEMAETLVSHAASFALMKTHAILQLTQEHAQSLPAEERLTTDEEKDAAEPLRKTRRMRGRELRLVQGQNIIRGTELAPFRRLKPWVGFWNE